MLLMQKPVLMLVDEPVAGMTRQEMEKTAELLTSLAGQRSIIVVEHDMDFVRSIAKKVTVLHQGSILAEGQHGRDPKQSKGPGSLPGRITHAYNRKTEPVLRRKSYPVGPFIFDQGEVLLLPDGQKRRGGKQPCSTASWALFPSKAAASPLRETTS